MAFGRTKTAGVLMAVASVVLFAGAAGAQGAGKQGDRGPQAALRAQVQQQNVLLDEGIEDLSAMGARLEDTQAQLYRAQARARELRSQTRALKRDLKVYRETFEASKEDYEEQARAAYKGDDLEGLMALLQSLLGNNAAFSLSHDFRVAGILLDSQENLDNYEDSRQTLSNTIRQISQKKSAYNEVLEEQKARTADLRRQEEKLDAAIARIRSDRNVAEARLQELKVRERERIRKTRSATGGDSPPQAEEKPRDVVNTPRDSSDKPRVGGDKPREGGGDRSRDGGDEPRDGGHKPRDDRDTLQDNAGNPRGEGDTLRETENEVAQEDIFVQPLEHVSRATYLRLYQKAARDYGFARDWYILAAVGKVESNHGESMGTSSAGAMGPMQFLPSTWESSGVDGNGDGKANIMDPRDAIPAAAGYLRDGGAPGDWYAALYSYNHADWYVKEVLAVAETYRKAAKDDRVGPYV